MMNNALMRKMLVLSGELACIEEAPRTGQMIAAILDLLRHCSQNGDVTLYQELEAMDLALSCLESTGIPTIAVHQDPHYKSIDVAAGEGIDCICRLMEQSSAFPVEGILRWDVERSQFYLDSNSINI